MRRRTILLATIVALVATGPAHAASRVIIRGGGFGHGIGMSQYGALGYAKHGKDHAFILAHYYTGTRLGRLSGAARVRVLLQTTVRVSFSGAVDLPGAKKLNPAATYRATRNLSGGVVLRTAAGKLVGTYGAPLTIAGSPGGLRLRGRSGNAVTNGRYRGNLQLRPAAVGGLNAINELDLDSYVRGVVAGESPSSWPAEALRAQAVAARTYAITTSKRGAGFDQYADTRSQVYNGIAGERASTDAAVAATSGEVVTYQGKPVVTYYFSTSGGRTENIEYAFLGAAPKPWLKSVDDPYDDESPEHSWVVRLTLGSAQRKLGGLVKGSLRRIRVLQRGRSPRVVRAQVIGTKGRRNATGPTLRDRFGLLSTYARFTVITSAGSQGDGSPPPSDSPSQGGTPAGGVTPKGARAVRRALVPVGSIGGHVAPAVKGAVVTVQRREGDAWTTVAQVPLAAHGRYRALVPGGGRYRVVYRGEAGPAVRVG
jgi:stage II sporulation protein D